MKELIYILWGVAFALSFISSFKFFQHWFLYGHPLVAFGFKKRFLRDERVIGKHTNEPNVCGNREDLRKKLYKEYNGYRTSGMILPDKPWSRS